MKKLESGSIITIIGKKWFDKINGNTYHTAEVFVGPDRIGKSEMTYGYGDHYQYTGIEILKTVYDIGDAETPYEIERNFDVKIFSHVKHVSKRKL